MDDVVAWSCGGGVQSAAIGALIVAGKLPPPDVAYIVDTGREASGTWEYFDEILRPALAQAGVGIHRVPHTYATVDLLTGKDKQTIIMPMYTKGGRGKLQKYCSNEWKQRAAHRWLKDQGYTTGVEWIGFSLDEMQRTKAAGMPWEHKYPLIKLKMDRGDCIKAVENVGWPQAPRSSCWMCPYRSDAEWKHLKQKYPRDFAAAVRLETELQRIDADAYFHRSGVPLDEADLNENQPDIFECNSGYCFT